MKNIAWLGLLSGMVIGGCAEREPITLGGTVEGGAAEGQVRVLWSVPDLEDPEGDGETEWIIDGEGEAFGGTFSVTLDEDEPPADAQVLDIMAFGWVVVLPSGVALPATGARVRQSVFDAAIARTRDDQLVWLGDDGGDSVFREGYNCIRPGEPDETGVSHGERIPCSELRLVVTE
jgi:hypothetical protein